MATCGIAASEAICEYHTMMAKFNASKRKGTCIWGLTIICKQSTDHTCMQTRGIIPV